MGPVSDGLWGPDPGGGMLRRSPGEATGEGALLGSPGGGDCAVRSCAHLQPLRPLCGAPSWATGAGTPAAINRLLGTRCLLTRVSVSLGFAPLPK